MGSILRSRALALAFVFLAVAGVLPGTEAEAISPPTAQNPWRAIHVINYTSDESLSTLEKQLPELAKLGINCLMLEVNYHFEFQSHPGAANTAATDHVRRAPSDLSTHAAQTASNWSRSFNAWRINRGRKTPDRCSRSIPSSI